jgi:hypothetical protein
MVLERVRSVPPACAKYLHLYKPNVLSERDAISRLKFSVESVHLHVLSFDFPPNQRLFYFVPNIFSSRNKLPMDISSH